MPSYAYVGPLRPTGRGPQAKGRGEANQARRPARAIQRVRHARYARLIAANRLSTSAARQKPCRAASTNVRSRRGDCGVVRSSAVDCVGIRCKSRWGRRAPRRGRRCRRNRQGGVACSASGAEQRFDIRVRACSSARVRLSMRDGTHCTRVVLVHGSTVGMATVYSLCRRRRWTRRTTRWTSKSPR